MSNKIRLPGVGTILAWLGIIGTLLGILGFFISDLPALLSGKPQGLSEADLVATLVALQGDKERAELQLTQIALANVQSANQMTEQALAQREADFQATLSAIQAEKDEAVATQNANSGMTATADSINATSTQVALDVAATAAAIAQIMPTPTPAPTATAVPAPVADYRALLDAEVRLLGGDRMRFSAQTLQPIPDNPPDGLAYVWLLDTDRNPETGQSVQDIGVDKRVAVKFDTNTWVGTVRSVQQDGAFGESFVFLDIAVKGSSVVAEPTASDFDLPGSFDWVIRVEIGEQVFGLWPTAGHFSLN